MLNSPFKFIDMVVAPARERGLKYGLTQLIQILMVGRSREGAWIEIIQSNTTLNNQIVAPARERGLKLLPMRSLGENAVSLPRGSVD